MTETVNKSTLRSYQMATAISKEEVIRLFTYQPWNETQIEQGKLVREALASAFEVIVNHVPPCPTRTRALNYLIDARMLANAAITFNGEL
jgi:hypothetical protein